MRILLRRRQADPSARWATYFGLRQLQRSPEILHRETAVSENICSPTPMVEIDSDEIESIFSPGPRSAQDPDEIESIFSPDSKANTSDEPEHFSKRRRVDENGEMAGQHAQQLPDTPGRRITTIVSGFRYGGSVDQEEIQELCEEGLTEVFVRQVLQQAGARLDAGASLDVVAEDVNKEIIEFCERYS